MGFDNKGLKKPRSDRFAPKSENPYLLQLVRLYRFLARRTNSRFNARVLNRLCLSGVNKASMSLSRIVKFAGSAGDKIVVVPTAVLDDARLPTIPKLRICALRFSKSAVRRIAAAGGEVLTFDQLALQCPTGKNTILLRGRKTRREVNKRFGAAGTPGSHAKPKCANRKNERARGKRNSRQWKVRSFKYAQK